MYTTVIGERRYIYRVDEGERYIGWRSTYKKREGRKKGLYVYMFSLRLGIRIRYDTRIQNMPHLIIFIIIIQFD